MDLKKKRRYRKKIKQDTCIGETLKAIDYMTLMWGAFCGDFGNIEVIISKKLMERLKEDLKKVTVYEFGAKDESGWGPPPKECIEIYSNRCIVKFKEKKE